MTGYSKNLDRAWAEVSASSAGGAPFLICFGATILIAAIASFFISERTAALVAIFQGAVALPLSVGLERKLAKTRMSAENPLRPLSVQLAMSQVVAFPAVIVIFSVSPRLVPVTLAAIGGGHFLPYAWLQRTRVYAVLAVAMSLGGFALQVVLRQAAFPYVLLYISLLYFIAAPLVYLHAARQE